MVGGAYQQGISGQQPGVTGRTEPVQAFAAPQAGVVLFSRVY